MPRADYVRSVEQILELIRAGEVYQVNFSQRIEGPWAGDAIGLLERVVERNPAPFGALVRLGADSWLLSASPERFLRIDGRRVVTRPIKGTIGRGATPREDAANARALLESREGPGRARDDHRPPAQRPLALVPRGHGRGRRAVRARDASDDPPPRRDDHAARSRRGSRSSTSSATRGPAARSRASRRSGRCRSSTSSNRRVAGPTPGRSAGSGCDGRADLEHPDPHDAARSAAVPGSTAAAVSRSGRTRRRNGGNRS